MLKMTTTPSRAPLRTNVANYIQLLARLANGYADLEITLGQSAI